MKTVAEGKKRKQTSELLGDRENLLSKKRIVASGKSFAASKQNGESSAVEVGGNKKTTKLFSGSNFPMKEKVHDVCKKKLKSPNIEENKVSLGERMFDLVNKGSGQLKLGKPDRPEDGLNKAAANKPATNSLSNEPLPLDADSERRYLFVFQISSIGF